MEEKFIKHHPSPLVTVITPSYNSPDIWQAIDSVLEQSYPCMEYLLADDASISFSEERVMRYIQEHKKDTVVRFQIMKNPKNMGTVCTLNRALSEAKGKYIFFLAGDDKFHDAHVITDWVHAFENSGALVMTARRELYDTQLKTCLGSAPSQAQIKILCTLKPQTLFEKLAVTNFVFGCCTAYARECFDKYGAFDVHYHLIEDHPMVLRLLRSGEKIFFFDRTVVCYRGGGISAEVNFSQAYMKEADEIFRREALPYVTGREKALRSYRKWRKEQQLRRRFASYKAMAGDNHLYRALAYAWFYAHNPVDAVSKIVRQPCKLRKLFDRQEGGA